MSSLVSGDGGSVGVALSGDGGVVVVSEVDGAGPAVPAPEVIGADDGTLDEVLALADMPPDCSMASSLESTRRSIFLSAFEKSAAVAFSSLTALLPDPRPRRSRSAFDGMLVSPLIAVMCSANSSGDRAPSLSLSDAAMSTVPALDDWLTIGAFEGGVLIGAPVSVEVGGLADVAGLSLGAGVVVAAGSVAGGVSLVWANALVPHIRAIAAMAMLRMIGSLCC